MTTDIPTPAPTLTDEQIDYFTGIIRECATDSEVIMPSADVVDRWLAAIEARAKREERGRIAPLIRPKVDREALARVLAAHQLTSPTGGTASSARCTCSCGHVTDIPGGDRDFALIRAQRHQADAILAFLGGEA